MSDKPQFPRAAALAVADELVAALTPVCERIAVAGSLRRGKESVGDVEIVFVPRVESRAAGLFGEVELISMADARIADLLSNLTLKKRPSAIGVETWGPLNKLAVHANSGIPVDLFAEPDAANWIRTLVLRTGPKEFNIKLVESALFRGYRLHAYGPAFTRIGRISLVHCPKTEDEFFKMCGVKYLPPEDR